MNQYSKWSGNLYYEDDESLKRRVELITAICGSPQRPSLWTVRAFVNALGEIEKAKLQDLPFKVFPDNFEN